MTDHYTVHGQSSRTVRSPAYRSWDAMIQRCTNPKNPSFRRYGERGIGVCDRWLSFSSFFADMGDRPPGMSLDRVDGLKGYGPENCRWATAADQQSNRRNSVVRRRERSPEAP